ncbi:MAG TPA: isochorismatase family protein [Acidimicrobiales bacterium]|nr:isochorismatase family protein [Acidimicrobiales bacterium]
MRVLFDADLVAPDHTALVTVEVQDGVVGEHSLVPELARAAESILPNIAALARAARSAAIPVIHCTVDARADGLGANRNTRLFAALAKHSRGGSGEMRRATVHESVGASADDLVLGRLHGVSPMTATSLDPVLRNLGVTTIVAVGVSANVAVLGFAFEAVNLGYEFVLPRDAVAGVGDTYVDALFDGTFKLLATLTTTAALLEAWS